MKTKILILVAALAVVTSALAQDTNTVQITADQAAKVTQAVSDLAPMLPAKYQGLLNAAIGFLGVLAIIGRIIVGWQKNGLGGVIAGLFGGTNTPNPPPATQPKGASLLRNPLIILCLLLPMLFLAGCKLGPHQYLVNESGTGLKAKIPVGYNGNNIFELDLTVGTFKSTGLVQPVMTNRVYTPTLSVVASTRGKMQGNAMNSSTNPTVNVVGGDSYIIATGHAAAGITNSADASVQTWQDEATP